MPELITTLNAKQKEDYESKKFLAALKGIDIDKSSSNHQGSTWEEIKARAFSKGQTSNPNDIVSLQGKAAKRAGFGIGEGLDYEVM
jgi:hypothetical protein